MLKITKYSINNFIQFCLNTCPYFTNYFYRVFANKNSSYLTKAIITEASLMSLVIRAVLLIMSEIFVTVFIYILMRNKTIREKPLVSINNLGKSFKKL
jgi:hypothetical protein